MRPSRRAILAGGLALAGAGALAGLAAWLRGSGGNALAEDVGEMLMLGFAGFTVDSPSARSVAEHITAGRTGSVLFVKENIGSRDEVERLIALLTERAPSPPLVAIDHEGGAVQRLAERQGFTHIPPARKVARTMSPDEARNLYAKAAKELAAIGFNLNLGPVVDLDAEDNPAIGKYGRSYSDDPAVVSKYAAAFVEAFESEGILCAIKHFPGQGLATTDSHNSLPDISASWSEADLRPYRALIADGLAPIILGGHVRLGQIEPEPIPTTLSPKVTDDLLRHDLGFAGVAMTDDLDMSAAAVVATRQEVLLRAMAAGNDLLMVRNVDPFDGNLPIELVGWVADAIARGVLDETRITRSADRIRALRSRIGAGNGKARREDARS